MHILTEGICRGRRYCLCRNLGQLINVQKFWHEDQARNVADDQRSVLEDLLSEKNIYERTGKGVNP